MPRKYIRKTPGRSLISEEQILAAKELIEKGKSRRFAAHFVGISEATLRKRLKSNHVPTSLGRFKPTFTKDQEAEFAAHCKAMDERFFGVTMNDLRRLAYEFAMANNLEHRFDDSSGMAGRDWVKGFLKRNGHLRLRKSAPVSLARVIGFNKAQVQVPETIEQESNDKCTEFKYPILSTEESSTSSLHLVLKQEPNEEFEEFHEPLYKTEIPEPETNRECPLHTNDAEVQTKVSCENKSTSVSPERLFHTPEKDAIREHAARMKKQYQTELKLLKEKYKRCNTKATNLQTILNTLREKDVPKGDLPAKDNVACSSPARLTERHFIKKLPATIDNTQPARRCKVCSEKGMAQTGEAIYKETNYFCSECNVGLCLETCFELYHTQEKFI